MTGSVARGDESAGSDLDLWVISDRNETVHSELFGVAVTVMYETPERASSPRHWLNVEVSRAWVLVDRGGLFAKLKRRFAKAWPKLRRDIIAATHRERAAFERAAGREAPRWALQALRHAAMRVACLPVFERHELRDPRWRHLAAFHNARALRALRTVLGLERRPRKPALRDMPGAAAKWRAGEWEEALLKARHQLDAELFARVPATWRAREKALRSAPAAVKRRFDALHGPATPARLREAQLAYRQLIAAAGTAAARAER